MREKLKEYVRNLFRYAPNNQHNRELEEEILQHSLDRFDDLVDENLRIMEEQLSEVRALVDHPMSSDEVCAAVCAHMGVSVSTPKKAQSLERFLRPSLEFMVDEGSHRMVMRGTTLCYEPVD